MSDNIKCDIVKLIEKSPITRLSHNYNNKFIEKIKTSFNDNQQNLFVGSFYCYLNYTSKNDFVINFDDVWKWLGYTRKDSAKKLLDKHFIKDIDYKEFVNDSFPPPTCGGKQNDETRGGSNKEIIMLNIKTFKKLCLKANTDKADQIHEYFIKLEEVLQEIINEESDELKQQLTIKNDTIQEVNDTIKKLQIEKILEKHNILLREFGNRGPLVYIIKVKSFDDNTYIIKIGETRQGLFGRYNEHKAKYEEALILDCFIVNQSNKFETYLHNHSSIKSQRIKNLKNHEHEKELFLIGKDLSYEQLLQIINNNISNYNDYNNIQKELDNSKLEIEKLNLIKDINNNINTDDYQKFIKLIVDNNEYLINKIDKLEKNILELKEITNANNTRLNTKFNEPLKSIGSRLQKIDPITLKLVKVYETIGECLKEDLDMKRSCINKAISDNTIYKNYRWMTIDREFDANIVNIKQTRIIQSTNIGYIAKLDKERTKILAVYIDRKTASKFNNYPKESSLDNIVKKSLLSNENYYVLYNDCSEELKKKYDEPILYKNGVGKFDINNNLIKEFKCKYDCSRYDSIGMRSLNKVLLDNKLIYNGCYYKYMDPKLFVKFE